MTTVNIPTSVLSPQVIVSTVARANKQRKILEDLTARVSKPSKPVTVDTLGTVPHKRRCLSCDAIFDDRGMKVDCYGDMKCPKCGWTSSHRFLSWKRLSIRLSKFKPTQPVTPEMRAIRERFKYTVRSSELDRICEMVRSFIPQGQQGAQGTLNATRIDTPTAILQ